MRKFILKFVSILLMSLLYISCQSVDFDIPEKELISVNGLFTQYHTPVVHLSNAETFENRLWLTHVENAKVTMFEGKNIFGELKHITDGYYMLDGKHPEAGKDYKLEILVNGKYIDSHLRMPKIEHFNVKAWNGLTSIRTHEKYNEYLDEYTYRIDTSFIIDFNIMSNSVEGNYFRLEVLQFNPQLDSILSFQWGETLYFENMRPQLSYYGFSANRSNQDTVSSYLSALFTKEKIPPAGINLKVATLGVGENDYLYLCIYSVPEDYYRFIEKLELYKKFEDIDVQGEEAKLNPLSTADMPSYEPIIFPSNVENGTGLVSGLTLFIDSIKVDDVLTGIEEYVFVPHNAD